MKIRPRFNTFHIFFCFLPSREIQITQNHTNKKLKDKKPLKSRIYPPMMIIKLPNISKIIPFINISNLKLPKAAKFWKKN